MPFEEYGAVKKDDDVSTKLVQEEESNSLELRDKDDKDDDVIETQLVSLD